MNSDEHDWGDRITPVRYVATVLGTAEEAVPFTVLAKNYKHPVYSDLARVRHYQHLDSDDAAIEWIVRNAIERLNIARGPRSKRQVSFGGDDTFSLSMPFRQLRFRGQPIEPLVEHSLRGDPWNPQAPTYYGGLRGDIPEDDAELRQSMMAFGWIPELPALLDQNGALLVGSRRMKIAEELCITPVIKIVHIDDDSGDEGDKRRFRIAVASNVGTKTLSKNDKYRLTTYLYNDRHWSLDSIGAALRSSVVRTAELVRRRDVKRRDSHVMKHETPELDVEVRSLLSEGKATSRTKLGAKHGVGEKVVQLAVERARGYLQALNDVRSLSGRLSDADGRTPDVGTTAAEETLATTLSTSSGFPRRSDDTAMRT
jgi:hypothetical protein